MDIVFSVVGWNMGTGEGVNEVVVTKPGWQAPIKLKSTVPSIVQMVLFFINDLLLAYSSSITYGRRTNQLKSWTELQPVWFQSIMYFIYSSQIQ